MLTMTPTLALFCILILIACVGVLVLPAAWLSTGMNAVGGAIQAVVSWIANLFKSKQ